MTTFIQEEQNFKDCILFAIDCSKSMFTKNAQGDIPVTVALQSIKNTILSKIDSRPNDQIGVLLYGTVSKRKETELKSLLYLLLLF